MSSPARRSSGWSTRILLGLATGAAVLGMLELGARALFPAPRDAFETPDLAGHFDWRDPMPYVVFSATPDANVRIDRGAWVTLQAPRGTSAHVVTDPHGFRYAGDLSEPKEPGELRIFLLGGSVTVLGLTNASTVCGALERAIVARRGAAPRVRCISAGIMTGVSDQELARLVHHVARLSPDVVVSLSGFNDAVARQHFDPRLGAPLPWFVFEKAYREGRETSRRTLQAVDTLPAWKLLVSRSRLATTLWPGLALHQLATAAQIEQEVGEHERPSTTAVVEHLLANWELMDRISHAIGARFVGILQPCRPQERSAGSWAEFYRLAGEAIARRAASGAPVHSLADAFDDRPELFYDPVHTFDRGHPLLAERILAILIERELLDAS